jgi:hypothetical protein
MRRSAFEGVRIIVYCCLAIASLRDDFALAARKETDRQVVPNEGSVSKNLPCKLFSSAEVTDYIGRPVTSVEITSGGRSCKWRVGGGNGAMIFSIVSMRNHKPPKTAEGYRGLPGIGVEGFVVPELGGWVAGSIVGQQAIRVSLSGDGVTELSTVGLLEQAIKRYSVAPSRPTR